MSKKNANVHKGHRERLKKRFLEHGLDSFEDHVALELLLFFAIPRVDVNALAHELIERYGTLHSVFDASADDLMNVPGIGENAACLIKLLTQICRRYMISREQICNRIVFANSEDIGKFIMPHFFAENIEITYTLTLDKNRKLIKARAMFRGSHDFVKIDVRKVVEVALKDNADSIILVHNHLNGIALPSPDDVLTTRRVKEALNAVGISLFDHIIVAFDDFVSLGDSGFLDN